LITRLGNLKRLTVRPTSAVLKYAGRDTGALQIGRELGVESVLEGSLRRAGEKIRVTVQLVSVRDQKPLWAERFDEPFTDLFAVEDAISEKVAAALTLQITGEELKQLTRHYTANTEAYNLCLKGRFFFSKETEEGVKKGLEYLYQAIEIDPEYGLAHAWMADCYCWLSHFYVRPRDAMPKAQAAARRALAIDATLAEAHTSLALVLMWYEWDFAEAEREFLKALEMNPRYAVARLWYAFFLTAMGRQTEAVREVERARELDPLSLFINSGAGFPYYYLRAYEPALAQAERLIEMEPYFWTGHWLRGAVKATLGHYGEAIAALEKAITFSGGGAEMIAALAHVYAVAGRTTEARDLLTELRNKRSDRYVSPYHLAAVYTGLAEIDQALACLEQAYEDRSEWLVWLAVDPRIDGLRREPRFADLLVRVGLAAKR
jgi:tetratricopeptide (TPR) repeat protein